ncbi:sporulation protein YabP [Alkalihalobacillus sp. AL-G]|uniref:sporulation protein YabP n=1 Tax=Alkalihalobacillus sp. AL-G TaxID=2926399 RepID=UPI00272B30A0|nr:sporulation protein YabP [Alkalihalobacillus sp. AL-G]WLD93471.1 sporulation protein YabP [Alkalihalobacillus sp. AL-G]
MDQYYDYNGQSYNKSTTTAPDHDVKMRGRKALDITGVKQVESFDNEEFLLETSMGFLAVRGYNLKMKNLNLDQGLVSIEGKVYDLVYLDQQQGDKSKGFFSKLFK